LKGFELRRLKFGARKKKKNRGEGGDEEGCYLATGAKGETNWEVKTGGEGRFTFLGKNGSNKKGTQPVGLSIVRSGVLDTATNGLDSKGGQAQPKYDDTRRAIEKGSLRGGSKTPKKIVTTNEQKRPIRGKKRTGGKREGETGTKK